MASGDKIQIATKAELDLVEESKQDSLVSGSTIKTINGESILGSGDIVTSTALELVGSDSVTVLFNNSFTNTSAFSMGGNKFLLFGSYSTSIYYITLEVQPDLSINILKGATAITSVANDSHWGITKSEYFDNLFYFVKGGSASSIYFNPTTNLCTVTSTITMSAYGTTSMQSESFISYFFLEKPDKTSALVYCGSRQSNVKSAFNRIELDPQTGQLLNLLDSATYGRHYKFSYVDKGNDGVAIFMDAADNSVYFTYFDVKNGSISSGRSTSVPLLTTDGNSLAVQYVKTAYDSSMDITYLSAYHIPNRELQIYTCKGEISDIINKGRIPIFSLLTSMLRYGGSQYYRAYSIEAGNGVFVITNTSEPESYFYTYSLLYNNVTVPNPGIVTMVFTCDGRWVGMFTPDTDLRRENIGSWEEYTPNTVTLSEKNSNGEQFILTVARLQASPYSMVAYAQKITGT